MTDPRACASPPAVMEGTGRQPEAADQPWICEILQYRLQSCQALFAGLAHDLKSPLASLQLWADTLELLEPRLAACGDQQAITSMQTAVEQLDSLVRRSVRLVDDVLDTSRLEAGQPLGLVLADVDLVELARLILASRPESDAVQAVRLESTEAELRGWWDGERLGRVLDNLLSNAIKYSPPTTPIAVRVAREHAPDGGRWAILQVQDHGMGIPAADLRRVFEAFRRGRNVRPGMPGTGLGLWLCSHVVQQHGGTLSVTSQEGRGSTFTVRLPLTLDVNEPDAEVSHSPNLHMEAVAAAPLRVHAARRELRSATRTRYAPVS